MGTVRNGEAVQLPSMIRLVRPRIPPGLGGSASKKRKEKSPFAFDFGAYRRKNVQEYRPGYRE